MADDRLGYTFLLLSYLLGSIPFGLVVARVVAGVDVRHAGSGNIGATNVLRTAGRRLGGLTLLLDAAKGGIPVGVTALVMELPHDAGWPAAAGLAAFLGHVFPVWLAFRGGKGVATAFGAFVVLTPWLALFAAVVFAASVGLTGIASLSSMLAAAAITAGCATFHGPENPVTKVSLVVLAVVVVRHQSNIRRLIRGVEPRIRRRRG